jgi:serine/threonine protein kinase/WD40 repeat protein
MGISSQNWQEKTLGRYRLLRLLGRGAMGEVWQAEDTRLNRSVAIKLLPAVLRSEQGYLRLFEQEARVVAALSHPNILQIHDSGEAEIGEGEVVTYLVMPYIPGGTLRERLRTARGPLAFEEGLHYLRQAAQAIDYAHSQQVLHRDIKPANLLLNGAHLLLTDFGIARLLTSDTYRSRTNVGTGTAEYMAPEQAQGKAEAASDRYSLAMIAYQMFTGQLPFRGETAYDVMLKQISETAPPPRQFNPNLPQGVERVLYRGIAKRAEYRYPSCQSFVNELEAVWKGIEQEPLSSHSHPLAPSQSGPALQVVPSAQQVVDPLAPSMAPMQLGQGIFSTIQASPRPSAAGSSYTSAQPGFSQEETRLGVDAHPTELRPSSALPLQEDRQRSVRRRALLIGGVVAGVAVVGGSVPFALSRVAGPQQPIATPTPVPGPKQLVTGKAVLNMVGHSDVINNVVWDPTGRYVVSAGNDTRMMAWDVGTILQKSTGSPQALDQASQKWKFEGGISANRVSWTNDGRRLIFSGTRGLIQLFDVQDANKEPERVVDSSLVGKNSLDLPDYLGPTWQPYGDLLAAAELNLLKLQIKVVLWKAGKLTTPDGMLTYDDPTAAPQRSSLVDCAWSKDGLYVAGFVSTGKILVWDIKTRKVKTILEFPDRTQGKNASSFVPITIAWSPAEASRLAVWGLDCVAVYDISNPKPLYQLGTDDPVPKKAPKDFDQETWYAQISSLAWSPSGRYIAASYLRSTSLYVWDLKQPTRGKDKDGVTQLNELIFPKAGEAGHNNTVMSISWSPNGRYIASGGYDKTVIVWLVDGGK